MLSTGTVMPFALAQRAAEPDAVRGFNDLDKGSRRR